MSRLSPTQSRTIYVLLLAALPFGVYANSYRHAFQLDDTYTLVTNPAVRSPGNIPRYFVDPATYTSVREQVDYRPVLQVSYALDYALGGYDMPWWHFTQILLHALVAVGVFFLCRRTLDLGAGPPSDGAAFVAAAIFAVHPAASGVVNYLNARSSLLAAAFLLPALLAYMRPISTAGYARPQWPAAIWYALALFTKVEAVGALGALVAFELWQRGQESIGDGIVRSGLRAFDSRTFKRLAPALAISVIYFAIRWKVMSPFPFGESRHAADVGAYEYFVTQLTAWWYYVARWLAPVNLVADYLSYPVYRSWREPVVLLAAGGWFLVAAGLVVAWRRAPYLLFLAIAALALISPTSSIAPLAEMVNEHRPYLPIGVLSLAGVIPGAALIRRPLGAATRGLIVAGLTTMFVALSALTWQRNAVFLTDGAYWKDILDKAPSSRAHLNYGLNRMSAGDYADALKHYRASLETAPYWYYTHINLGVAHQYLGNADSARAHFDIAVENDRFSGQALVWRGEFNLAQRNYAAARADFLGAMPVNLQSDRAAKGLAAALMGEGIDLLGHGEPAGAAERFRKVLSLNPQHYGAHYQLAVALDRMNRPAEARSLWQTVLSMAEASNDLATIRTARNRLK